jgi:hypothetical protein
LNIHVVKYNQQNDPTANGITIYNNSDGTGTPTNGYYSRAGDVWYSTSGVLSGEAVCYSGPPPPPPTTAPPPPPPPSGYYYNVDTFGCSPCAATPFTGLIAYSPTSFVNNLYYNNGDGYVYYINYTYASPQLGYDIDLTGAAGASSCNSACSI